MGLCGHALAMAGFLEANKTGPKDEGCAAATGFPSPPDGRGRGLRQCLSVVASSRHREHPSETNQFLGWADPVDGRLVARALRVSTLDQGRRACKHRGTARHGDQRGQQSHREACSTGIVSSATPRRATGQGPPQNKGRPCHGTRDRRGSPPPRHSLASACPAEAVAGAATTRRPSQNHTPPRPARAGRPAASSRLCRLALRPARYSPGAAAWHRPTLAAARAREPRRRQTRSPPRRVAARSTRQQRRKGGGDQSSSPATSSGRGNPPCLVGGRGRRGTRPGPCICHHGFGPVRAMTAHGRRRRAVQPSDQQQLADRGPQWRRRARGGAWGSYTDGPEGGESKRVRLRGETTALIVPV